MLEAAADTLGGGGLSEEDHRRKTGLYLEDSHPSHQSLHSHTPPPSIIIPVRQTLQHHYSFLLPRDFILIDHLF